MARDREQPPVNEKFRLPMRIAAVVLAYVLYRRFDQPLMGGVTLGIGFLLLAWSTIERLTVRRQDRVDLIMVGQGLLGTGLVIAGLFVTLR